MIYIKTIKKIVEYLGDDIQYTMVTNGSLLTDEIVDYFNQHNFQIGISFDGLDSLRDKDPTIQWDQIGKLKNGFSVASLFYPENLDIYKVLCELYDIMEKHNIKRSQLNIVGFNFIHSIDTVHGGTQPSKEHAELFCKQIAKILESAIVSVYNFTDYTLWESKRGKVLMWILNNFYSNQKITKGVRCCNDFHQRMSLNGKFLMCPYDPKTIVGNVVMGIDWNKVNELIPIRCKTCEVFNSCQCGCWHNNTTLECYIHKILYRYTEKLFEKYNIDPKILIESMERWKRFK